MTIEQYYKHLEARDNALNLRRICSKVRVSSGPDYLFDTKMVNRLREGGIKATRIC